MFKNILLGIVTITIFVFGVSSIVIGSALMALLKGAAAELGNSITQKEASRLTTYRG